MAGVSIIDIIQEEVRQGVTGDRNYYKKLRYYFKLVTKDNAGPTGGLGQALFALPLNPESFEYDCPFASELSPGQDQGMTIENSGIVLGTIRIQASMAFNLRKVKDDCFSPGAPRFGSLLSQEEDFGKPISGQLHMWRLFGRLFDAYSNLKKDAETASETRLEFHSLKDDLHLAVEPRRVRISRNSGDKSRLGYAYSIELDVYGQAEKNDLDALLMTDEKSLFKQIMSNVANVRRMVRGVSAAIDDMTAALGEIKRTFSAVTGIVGDLKAIVSSAEDLVAGVKDFCDIPQETFRSVVSGVEDMRAAFSASLGSEIELDPNKYRSFYKVTRMLSNLEDTVDQLMVFTDWQRRRTWSAAVDALNNKMSPNANLTSAQLQAIADKAAAATDAPGTKTIDNTFGGPYSPGDAQRAQLPDQNTPNLGGGQYRGYREVQLTQGDTLESLAMRHLRDAGRWREIAMINRLRPPYISGRARIPGTKAVGDPILIPIVSSMSPVPSASLGSSSLSESQIEALYGIDLKLRQLGTGRWDWIVDYAHGSIDLQLVSKLDNLIQGLETRLRTERWTDLCFPSVGLPVLVGDKSFGATWMEARAAFQGQVLSDPRIRDVRNISFKVDLDVLEVIIYARPVGSDTGRTIPLTLE